MSAHDREAEQNLDALREEDPREVGMRSIRVWKDGRTELLSVADLRYHEYVAGRPLADLRADNARLQAGVERLRALVGDLVVLRAFGDYCAKTPIGTDRYDDSIQARLRAALAAPDAVPEAQA